MSTLSLDEVDNETDRLAHHNKAGLEPCALPIHAEPATGCFIVGAPRFELGASRTRTVKTFDSLMFSRIPFYIIHEANGVRIRSLPILYIISYVSLDYMITISERCSNEL
jgi:hypothetical protein